MNIDQIASEVLRLSPHDRAMLAQTIWESLRCVLIGKINLFLIVMRFTGIKNANKHQPKSETYQGSTNLYAY